MGHLTVRSPALWSDCLEMGASHAWARKANVYMRAKGHSFAFLDDDELLALAFLVEDPHGRLELALSIRLAAVGHMRRLCRLAHLTLRGIAETGTVVICHVTMGNMSGARMARLVGFIPSDGTLWTFGGHHDESDIGAVRRRIGQRRSESAAAEPAAAAGGERSPAGEPAAAG